MKRTLREWIIAGLNALPGHAGERLRFYRHHGYWPNVAHPTTFNEKILARKWHRGAFDYARYADKIAVKSFIAEEVAVDTGTDVDANINEGNGELRVIPTLATYDRLTTKALEALPLPCVIKCNHDSGSTRILKTPQDKSSELVEFFNSRLERSTGNLNNEYWYNDIKPRILVEPCLPLGQQQNVPEDYKFHYFAKTDEIRLQVDYDRFGYHQRGIYKEQGEQLSIQLNFPKLEKTLPANLPLKRMCEYVRAIAKRLAIDYVRIDLYFTNEQIFFGEITFAPEAGFGAFTPAHIDDDWGRLWG